MVESAVEGILVVQGARIVEANPFALRLFRATAEQVAAADYLDFTYPEDRAMIEERYRRRAAGEPVDAHSVYRVQDTEGHPIWVESHRAEIDWDGSPATLIFLTDLTRHKRTEDALKDSLANLRMTQQVGQLGHWIWEPSTGRVVWSEEMYRMFHLSAEQPMSLDRLLGSLIHPEDREDYGKAMRTAMTGLRMDPFVHRAILPDGPIRYVEVIPWERDLDEAGRVVRLTGLARDVTEKRLLEEEKQKAQRLESLGMLAAGIAHDFNNLLTGLFGSMELAVCKAGEGSEVAEELRHSADAFERMRLLTRQLLTFAKGGVPEKRAVSVGKLIRDAERLALSGSDVGCLLSIPEGLPALDADEGQVGQVLHNVLLNARQAMPGGGTIRVRASPRILDASASRAEGGLTPGSYVLIEIADRGSGIPAEDLPKVFDPFFTTKALGNGLGLATAYSIVKRHGGRIWMESRVGEGTTVRMLLPASAVPAKDVGRPAAAEKPAMGRGRILVMDDDALVRAVIAGMLRSLGYGTGETGDGETAVREYGEALRSGAPYDAVVLDLTVPGGMGGREAVERMRRDDPGLRAVVTSGYSADPVFSDPARYGFDAAVAKPCRREDLSLALEAALRSRDL